MAASCFSCLSHFGGLFAQSMSCQSQPRSRHCCSRRCASNCGCEVGRPVNCPARSPDSAKQRCAPMCCLRCPTGPGCIYHRRYHVFHMQTAAESGAGSPGASPPRPSSRWHLESSCLPDRRCWQVLPGPLRRHAQRL